jgi:hypothetical protein
MPWIKEEQLYPVLVLLLIFIIAVRMPMDSDMWWHLRAGEETLQTRQVYRIDTFSSSRVGENWINHSWLSQVIMALMFQWGSFLALSIWVAITAVLSMGLVYLQMEGHPLLRSAILVLAAIVSSVVWSPRPQIMSLLFLGLLSYILHIYRTRKNWTHLMGIPFLMALWGNLHGGYVLGLIYIGAFLAGEILDRFLLRDIPPALSWRDLGYVLAALIVGILSVLVNPFGFDMWRLPFNTIGIETLQNLINEWSSPDFHQAFQQPLLWMLLGLLGAVSISKRPIRGYQLVPILVFAWAALVARRNFGPFAIVCAPALADQLHHVLDHWLGNARKSSPGVHRFLQNAETNKETFNMAGRNLINATLIILLLVAGIIKAIQVNDPELVLQTESEFFPADAVVWLNDQEMTYKMFNDYNWGGYLIYKLPDQPVFVDGRTDLYGDQILNDYLKVVFCKEDWKMILDSYALDLALIRADSCLKSLALAEGWDVLYADNISLVLGNNH